MLDMNELNMEFCPNSTDGFGGGDFGGGNFDSGDKGGESDKGSEGSKITEGDKGSEGDKESGSVGSGIVANVNWDAGFDDDFDNDFDVDFDDDFDVGSDKENVEKTGIGKGAEGDKGSGIVANVNWDAGFDNDFDDGFDDDFDVGNKKENVGETEIDAGTEGTETLEDDASLEEEGTQELEISEELLEECYKRTPVKNGKWVGENGEPGERGDSMWVSDKPEVQEELQKFDLEGILYKNGLPNLEPVAIHVVNSQQKAV